MIVGCYTLHLYCDYPDDDYSHRGSGEWPGPGYGSFNGRTEAGSKREAIRKGWKFHRDGDRVLCPFCVAAGRKLPKPPQDGVSE
jgi:hypothetical protein